MQTSLFTLSNNSHNSLNTTDTSLVLRDTFAYSKPKSNVQVELHKDCIKFFNIKKNNEPSTQPSLTISLADFCGSHVTEGHQKNDQKTYLTIYAYVSKKMPNEKTKKPNKIKKRKRLQLKLSYDKHSTRDENLTHVNHWQNQLAMLSRLQSQANALGSDSDSFLKPFLVLVNPKSGSGKAKTIYSKKIVSVWNESNQQHKLVLTGVKLYKLIKFMI